jgi:hypothetical protein
MGDRHFPAASLFNGGRKLTPTYLCAYLLEEVQRSLPCGCTGVRGWGARLGRLE